MVPVLSQGCSRRALVISAGAACLVGVSARAQSSADPGANAPDRKDNLSEKLNQSNGVIKPRDDVDPGMTRPAPQTYQPTPVVPPPGSPGGDPNVHPK